MLVLESQRETDANISLETESTNNQLQCWTLLSGLRRQLRTWMQELEVLVAAALPKMRL